MGRHVHQFANPFQLFPLPPNRSLNNRILDKQNPSRPRIVCITYNHQNLQPLFSCQSHSLSIHPLPPLSIRHTTTMPIETVNLTAAANTPEPQQQFQPTADELRSIQDKMKDPVFVELMAEYMRSLEDPAARAEEEAYLEQAEREAREGGDYSFEFIFPRAGFVVELAAPTTRRISAAEVRKTLGGAAASPYGGGGGSLEVKDARTFVNFCASEKVEPHSEEESSSSSAATAASSRSKGRDGNWRVPVSVSAKRIETLAKHGPAGRHNSGEGGKLEEDAATTTVVTAASQLCYVFDAVFNPTTLSLADRSPRFLCFLVEIAVEQINAGYAAESNGFEFTRLPSSVTSIGVPKNQTVRKKDGTSPFSAISAADPVLTRPTKHLYPKANNTAATATSNTTKAKAEAKVSNNTPPQSSSVLPPHTIAHRGSIDLTDAWEWKVSDRRVGIPQELVVRLTFAGVASAAALDIDITDDGAAVRVSKTPQQRTYDGLLVLPFTVALTPRKATLDKVTGTLTLVLAVVPPAISEEDRKVAGEVRERFVAGGNDAGGGDSTSVAAAAATVVEATEPSSNAEAGSTVPSRVEVAVEKEEEEPPSAAAVDAGEASQVSDILPVAATAQDDKETKQGNEEEEEGQNVSAAPAITSAAAPAPLAASSSDFTADSDRARVMMGKVMEARRAREAAAAAAEEREEVEEGKDHDSSSAAATDIIPKQAAATTAADNDDSNDDDGDDDAQATDTTGPNSILHPTNTGNPATAAATKEAEEDSIPFIRKRDPAAADAAADGEAAAAAALRDSQDAWVAMVREQMAAVAAGEDLEAAEAERLTEVETLRAAKRLAAVKVAEVAEARVRARMAAVPVANRYIFSID